MAYPDTSNVYNLLGGQATWKPVRVIIGHTHDDTLKGGDESDHISGGSGRDTLVGGAGDDAIWGGDGKDLITGGPGADHMVGDDTTMFGDTFVIRAGDLVSQRDGKIDEITDFTGAGGYALNEDFIRFEGFGVGTHLDYKGTDGHGWQLYAVVDPTVYGNDGNFWIHTADGSGPLARSDYVFANPVSVTTVTGDAGDNMLRGANWPDLITGEAGNDLIAGDAGNDRLSGGPGNDTIYGGAGNDLIDTGSTADPTPAADRVYAGDGNDSILYFNSLWDPGAPAVFIDGGNGIDTLYTEGVVTQLTAVNVEILAAEHVEATLDVLNQFKLFDASGFSENVHFILSGTGGAFDFAARVYADHFDGETGITTYHQEAGVYAFANNLTSAVQFIGGSNRDYFQGSAFNDVLKAGAGDDWLAGGAGNDNLQGGAGRDIIDGGAGKDLITGGPGADILTGGAGGDTFVIRAGDLSADLTTDIITDFSGAGGYAIDQDFIRFEGYSTGATLEFVSQSSDGQVYMIHDPNNSLVDHYLVLSAPAGAKHLVFGDYGFFN